MAGGPTIGYATLQVIPAMQGAAKQLQQGLGGVGASAGAEAGGRFGGKFQSAVVPSFAKIGGALGAAFAVQKTTDFFKGAISEASDLGESINAVNVTFGDAAGGIQALSDNAAKAVGLSKVDFNGLAVQFSSFAGTIAGSGGDIVGVMGDITGRASDFASVMNLDVSESARLFQSGLAGETEPLRKYGIDLSAAAVEAFALSKGIVKNKSELTEAAKVQARYGLLMESTSKAQGDFANTSDSLANRQRILAAQWDNVKGTIGKAFLPIMEGLASFASKTLIPVFEKIGPAFAVIGDAVRPAIDGIRNLFAVFSGGGDPAAAGPLAGIMEKFREAMPLVQQVADVFRSAWDAIKAIFKAGVAIVSGFWDRFGTHILGFIQRTVGNLLQIFEGVFRAIRGVFEVFAGIFTGDWSRVWGGIQQIVSGIWSAIQGVLKQALEIIRTVIGGAMAAISQIWSLGWNALKTFVSTAWRNVTGAVRDGISGLLDWFRHLPDRIFTAIGDLAGRMLQFGKDLIAGLIEGALSMAGTLAKSVGDMVYRNTVGKVKGLLGMQSPSKVFRDIGRNAMIGMALGAGDEQDRVARAFTTSTDDLPTPGWSLPAGGTAPSLAERAGRVFGDITIQGAEKPEDTAWALRKLALEMA